MVNRKHLFLRLGLIVTLLVVAVPRIPIAHSAVLDEIRLSFQHDPRTTITLMWRTDSAIIPSVQYGTTTAYNQGATGTNNPAVADGFFYSTVELTGLAPATLYHYRVNGSGNSWSSDYTFQTAPQGAADFSFTASGDNGVRSNSPQETLTTKDLVAAQHPSFHIVPGDITYSEGQKSQWEEWFQEVERFSHSVPLVPALGNHDAESGVKFSSGEYFYQRSFALPSQNQELYYSYDYGDVHFVALNSEDFSGLRRGGVQYNWLAADLAATSKKFKIVFYHRLTYTSGSDHRPEDVLQKDVSPLFDQYHVDLVINAHNHQYERTYPLRFGSFENPVVASSATTAYTNPEGTVYLTTGGGGHSLYNFRNPQPAWSASRCKCNEIVRVDVSAQGVLTVRAIDTSGATVDQFSISKNASTVSQPASGSATSTSSSSGSSSASGSSTTPSSSGTPASSSTSSISTSSVSVTSQTIRGFNFAVWWHDTLDQASTQESIRNMKNTGANYFGLAPFWYQDNKTSTTIYRDGTKTATDSSVRSAIRYAKSLGLKVALKPMVDSRDGTWRGQLTPSNTDAWFQSYRDFMLTFARIAQEEHADYLVLGTEFVTLTKPENSARWRNIIRDVRTLYSGPLTYAANWGKRSDGEYYQINFWDALDAIGIDAYFPLAENNTPAVQSVVNAWTSVNSGGTQNWFSDINDLHTRFNKPVIFTEIGYLGCDGTGTRPWEYPCSRSIDPQEQADLYEGTLKFWADKNWMQGYLFWRWDASPSAGGSGNGDFMPQHKPAEQVLQRYWSLPPAIPTSSLTTSQPAQTGGSSNTSPSTSSSSGSSSSGGSSSGSSSSSNSTNSGSPPTGGYTYYSPSSGSSGIQNLPYSGPTTWPTGSMGIPPFAYGLPRRPLPVEREAAARLHNELVSIFRGQIPIRAAYWHIYVNAYLYGGYPANVLAQSLRLGGKVVHPSIQYSAWRQSRDFQRYMR